MSSITQMSPGSSERRRTLDEKDNFLSHNGDLVGLVFRNIPVMEKGEVNPFLLSLQKVNKVFRDAVKDRIKNGLTGEKIGSFLKLEATKRNLGGIRFLMNCDNFNHIPATGNFGFGVALCFAACNGHLEAVQALIQCDNFNHIPATGEYGLGHALRMAAYNRHLETLQALMQCEKFKEIPATDEHGLGHALCKAAEYGHSGIIEALRSCDNFNHIPATGEYGLGEALWIAASNGHGLEMFLLMVNIPCMKRPHSHCYR